MHFAEIVVPLQYQNKEKSDMLTLKTLRIDGHELTDIFADFFNSYDFCNILELRGCVNAFVVREYFRKFQIDFEKGCTLLVEMETTQGSAEYLSNVKVNKKGYLTCTVKRNFKKY